MGRDGRVETDHMPAATPDGYWAGHRRSAAGRSGRFSQRRRRLICLLSYRSLSQVGRRPPASISVPSATIPAWPSPEPTPCRRSPSRARSAPRSDTPRPALATIASRALPVFRRSPRTRDLALIGLRRTSGQKSQPSTHPPDETLLRHPRPIMLNGVLEQLEEVERRYSPRLRLCDPYPDTLAQ